eukprot:TRINITY_DN20850_c0_g1_i1.p1 TRINITY_DN20850_c0_g1~~TRINITY_DN20850_c0_g1_i1.p1  ORF type:complete len:489 (-),score=107.62 TRINITY_DN20850_c0_g1_i1:387-1853(-)
MSFAATGTGAAIWVVLMLIAVPASSKFLSDDRDGQQSQSEEAEGWRALFEGFTESFVHAAGEALDATLKGVGCDNWGCIKTFNGPVYMLGQMFLLYAGFVADTLFIRMTLVMGAIMTCLWNELGGAQWPEFINQNGKGIKLDAYFWCALSVMVNGTPAVRQLLHKDSVVKFEGSYRDIQEHMWRVWHRRTGVSRTDFKFLMSLGDFVEFPPDTEIPMTEDAEPRSPGEFGDLFYYVCAGRVDGTVPCPEGNLDFVSSAGSFVDQTAFLAFLGHAPIMAAVQSGVPKVIVDKSSTFSRTLEAPRSHFGSEASIEAQGRSVLLSAEGAGPANEEHLHTERNPGALLFRWKKKDLSANLFKVASFAPDALKLAVTQAALDSTFRMLVKSTPSMEKHKAAYVALDRERRRLDLQPIPDDAADQHRPFLQQWYLSQKPFWRITPQERAVNSVRCGSRELERMEQLRLGRASLATLRTKSMAMPFTAPEEENDD